MNMKRYIMIGVVGLFLVFILQNTEIVSVRFLFWKMSMSRIILLTLTAATGFLAGFLVARR